MLQRHHFQDAACSFLTAGILPGLISCSFFSATLFKMLLAFFCTTGILPVLILFSFTDWLDRNFSNSWQTKNPCYSKLLLQLAPHCKILSAIVSKLRCCMISFCEHVTDTDLHIHYNYNFCKCPNMHLTLALIILPLKMPLVIASLSPFSFVFIQVSWPHSWIVKNAYFQFQSVFEATCTCLIVRHHSA